LNGRPFTDRRKGKMESPSPKTFRFHHPPSEARGEASPARPQWPSLSIHLASEAGGMKRSAHPVFPYLARSHSRTEPARRKEKRRFRCVAGDLCPSARTTVAGPSVPLASKISGRPCVGGNPGRTAHQRRKNLSIRPGGKSHPVPAEGPPLVPGSSRSFPGTQGLPEIFLATGTDGSAPELTGNEKGRFAFALNRLFSFLDASGFGVLRCLVGQGLPTTLRPDEPKDRSPPRSGSASAHPATVKDASAKKFIHNI